MLYYLARRSRPPAAVETAYILPESATVSDSPAEVRLGVETLRQGERVEVLDRTRSWARVRIPDGRTGWIELTDILDGAAYEGRLVGDPVVDDRALLAVGLDPPDHELIIDDEHEPGAIRRDRGLRDAAAVGRQRTRW